MENTNGFNTNLHNRGTAEGIKNAFCPDWTEGYYFYQVGY